MAGGGGLLLHGGAAAAVWVRVSGRRRGAGAAGGAEAADAVQSGGAARLHAGRRRRPALLLAAVCSGLVRLPALLPLQPPQPRGPQRRAGAGTRNPHPLWPPFFFFYLSTNKPQIHLISHLNTCLTLYRQHKEHLHQPFMTKQHLQESSCWEFSRPFKSSNTFLLNKLPSRLVTNQKQLAVRWHDSGRVTFSSSETRTVKHVAACAVFLRSQGIVSLRGEEVPGRVGCRVI